MKLFWYGVIVLWFVLVFVVVITGVQAEGIVHG